MESSTKVLEELHRARINAKLVLENIDSMIEIHTQGGRSYGKTAALSKEQRDKLILKRKQKLLKNG